MIMSMLGKLFKKKKQTVQQFKLCIVDDTTSDLWITLGITEKRRDEIIAICENALQNNNTKTDCYKEIIDQCTHINEVVPACIIFERICDRDNNPLVGLIKMLSREDD